MSYVVSAHAELERPYYILTNLEDSFVFRYDNRKSKPLQQILEPGLQTIGSFTYDSEVDFKNKLVLYYEQLLADLFQDNYAYSLTLSDFNEYMKSVKDNPQNWKSSLVILLYEYIRGAFSIVNRNRDLRHISLFRDDIQRICREAIQVNFDGIFNYNATEFLSNLILDINLKDNMYELGRNNILGDSVADVLHQIVSEGHEHEGEVPTDLELARCVSILAKHYSDTLTVNDYVCDPAAGSGNLISEAVRIFGLEPHQIKANDINKQLIELQSLRLGLDFAQTINTPNTPTVSTKNITELTQNYFNDIKVLVINPPFLAGINAVVRKEELFRRISNLTGQVPLTRIGQIGLEAVFIELINVLAKPDTVITAIIPKTYLTARGPEAVLFRKFLVNDFNMQLLFTYPGEDIFEGVVKDTCVIVGRKDCNSNNDLKVISSYIPIPDMNLQDFENSLQDSLNYNMFTNLRNGIVGCAIPRQQALDQSVDGWRNFDSEIFEATQFVLHNIKNNPNLIQIQTLGYPARRGNVGNSGASDLMFLNYEVNEINNYISMGLAVAPGMRNARLDSFIVGNGDTLAIDFAKSNSTAIDNIISDYCYTPRRSSRQQRRVQSEAQLLNVVERDSSIIFPPNSILVPRGLRTQGKVYLVDKPLRVSTNFLAYMAPDRREADLLGSWMLTIFYQLNCEVSSKDQEGMRKMEKSDIDPTYVPIFSNINHLQYQNIQSALIDVQFLNLNDPVIRDIDSIWAEILFGNQASYFLNEAKNLLSYIATSRSGI